MSIKKAFKFKDRLIKGISEQGYFKISVVKTTDVIRTARDRHQLSLLNTVLLGRSLTASLLLASELKGEERIRLRFEGSGPAGMVLAEANRAGEVRGYVQHPEAEPDYSVAQDNIGVGLGTGLLTVSKVLYNEAEPRTSTIRLHEGNITADIAHYLAQSEQVLSAILIDEKFDDEGHLIEAGGLMLQRLPDAPGEVMDILHKKLADFPPVSTLLDQDIYIDDIMNQSVQPYIVKDLDRHPVHFFCRCNKDRFISALSMLGYEELREMEGESQEIVCHFCNNRIEISEREIQTLLTGAQARMN